MGVRKLYNAQNASLQRTNVVNLVGQLNNMIINEDVMVKVAENTLKNHDFKNWDIALLPGDIETMAFDFNWPDSPQGVNVESINTNDAELCDIGELSGEINNNVNLQSNNKNITQESHKPKCIRRVIIEQEIK